jgi:hypothetical protein
MLERYLYNHNADGLETIVTVLSEKKIVAGVDCTVCEIVSLDGGYRGYSRLVCAG